MKFTYTMAEAITLSGIFVGWVPVMAGLRYPDNVLVYAIALVMVLGPYTYDHYGPGLDLR